MKMALKLRKDIKKSSYYVWFLGAKESKGLRGNEYILPVIKHLEQREKDIEPFKVTLQVSHKGLKIIQNVTPQSLQVSQNGGKSSKAKNETIKHFIPDNTITCVYQHDDVIACILLLFNPVTKCPLHVHAYRCDSLETATLLKQQLQILIGRPENQKKFAEIENRLMPVQQPVKKVESSLGSDTGTSTRESESSEERFVVENTRVTSLYTSVAAELREKLNKNKVPILLPPRDYDTVHRQKGNLTGIELRRCLNANIVGQNVKNSGPRRLESSGGSSGIGSDHPPSPDSPDAPDSRFNTMDNHSTSEDEDWNGDPAESTLYMMHSPHQVTLPRPTRDKSPSDSRYSRNSDKNKRELAKFLEKPMSKYEKYQERARSHENDRGRTVDRKETRKPDKPRPVKYFNDDGFDENLRYRSQQDFDRPNRRSYEDDEEFFEDMSRKYREVPVPKTRQKYVTEELKRSFERTDRTREESFERTTRSFDRNDRYDRYYDPPVQYAPRHKSYDLRQRTPSPKVDDSIKTSPRDRFKNAKEKFLSMEKHHPQRHYQQEAEPPISPITKDKPQFLKRHESMSMMYERNERPKPAPRNLIPEEVRYRNDRYQHRTNPDKYEPKRRSMYSLIEEEHRKNSNEIARELAKRRSYMDDPDDIAVDARMANYSRSSVDLVGGRGEGGGGSNGGDVKKSPGYRHSYAEPKLQLEQMKKKHYPGGGDNNNMSLHRTNSVSNSNGRVGIASVHPY